jgi:hypothetical protein
VSVATAPPGASASSGVYRRHRPETTALYEVVRDNLETLYGAIDDGAIAVRILKHARKELEAYLDCGLLCRSFARLRCLPAEACRQANRPCITYAPNPSPTCQRLLAAVLAKPAGRTHLDVLGEAV